MPLCKIQLPYCKKYAALGVPPARLKNEQDVNSKGIAAETAALPARLLFWLMASGFWLLFSKQSGEIMKKFPVTDFSRLFDTPSRWSYYRINRFSWCAYGFEKIERVGYEREEN